MLNPTKIVAAQSKPIDWLKARAQDPNVQRRRAWYLERTTMPGTAVKVTAAGWEIFPKDRRRSRFLREIAPKEPIEAGLWTTLTDLHGESSCQMV
jgi:hypothetical protein